MNLFNIIKSDLSSRGKSLNSLDELFELRIFAQNRANWKNLYDSGDTD